MDLSPEKIFVIGVIAVMVLGPDRLPIAARTAGRMLAEFRRWSAGVQREVNGAIAQPREALGQSADELGLNDLRKTITGARFSLRGALNEVVNGATGQGPGPALSRPVMDAPAVQASVVPPSGVGAPALAAAVDQTDILPGPGVPVLLLPTISAPDDVSLN